MAIYTTTELKEAYKALRNYNGINPFTRKPETESQFFARWEATEEERLTNRINELDKMINELPSSGRQQMKWDAVKYLAERDKRLLTEENSTGEL